MDKRRRRPFPDAAILKPLAFDLEEVLQAEHLFRPNLSNIIQKDIRPGEVTLKSRDTAVNVLQFFRVWLDIPHSLCFSAISFLDMFLAKMKVQEKYLTCLTLSCLVLATENSSSKIDINKLIRISQSNCSSSDVFRMASIVKEKIKLSGREPIITPADFLRIYIEIFKCVTKQWEHIISKNLIQVRERMLILLEVLLANSCTAYLRPSALALIIFQIEVEKIMAQGLPNKSVYYLGEVLQFLSMIREIQLKCKIKNVELKTSYLQICKVLKQYDSQKFKTRHQQPRLKFSLSTISLSARKFCFQPLLHTIGEEQTGIL